jgi:hypothetical protein
LLFFWGFLLLSHFVGSKAKFHDIWQSSTMKFHNWTCNTYMWITKCAFFIWINFEIRAPTSIFAFKWHILNLMKEGH